MIWHTWKRGKLSIVRKKSNFERQSMRCTTKFEILSKSDKF